MTKIIDKLRKKIIKNEKILLRIQQIIKRLYLIILIGVICIFLLKEFIVPYIYFLNNPVLTNNTRVDINTKYEKQVHISEFETFFTENKPEILKILFPEQEFSNYFQIILLDEEKNGVEYYKIYKNINEEWENFNLDENNLNTFNEKTALGLYYEPISNRSFADFVSILFPLLMLGFLGFLAFRMMGIGTGSPLTLFKPTKKYSFDEIGGLDGHKEELQEIIETLHDLKHFKNRGVRPIRGVLFYGPPGTGKTLLAKTIASQVNMEIFIASANDFGSKYINEGPQKVKKSFKEIETFIKKHKREYAILFVDELDSIMKERGSGHSEDDKVVNSFLDRIDGIEGSANIILIGATNHMQNIDQASLSRFDKKIGFKLPTHKERLDIAQKILKKRKETDPLLEIKDNLDLSNFAGNTEGMSGRDIESILNEIHRSSVLHGYTITEELIQEKTMDHFLGRENKGIDFDENDLNVVTYHELGHAFIGHINGDNVHTVTIVPRGPSLGSAWILPSNVLNLQTPDILIKRIQGLLGGRMAEKVFLGEITTGASNDYERATEIAKSYFKDYNFSYNGYSLGFVLNQNNNPNNPMIDNQIFAELNQNIKKLIQDQEKIVEDMIEKNKNKFENLHGLLVAKKTIYKKDFKDIFNEK